MDEIETYTVVENNSKETINFILLVKGRTPTQLARKWKRQAKGYVAKNLRPCTETQTLVSSLVPFPHFDPNVLNSEDRLISPKSNKQMNNLAFAASHNPKEKKIREKDRLPHSRTKLILICCILICINIWICSWLQSWS